MHEIKCPNCGKFSSYQEHCPNCGSYMLLHEKRKEKRQRKKKKSADPSPIEKMRKNSFFLVRWVGFLLHYVWFTFVGIGAFIAWVIATLAA